MTIQPEKFLTYSLQRCSRGADICQILAAALNHADAGLLIQDKAYLEAGKLRISETLYDLESFKRIFIIGAGKAVVPMTFAMSDILGDRLTFAQVITKDGYVLPIDAPFTDRIKILEAGHPIPDRRNLQSTLELLSLVQDLDKDDLVICLISGGGSSLLLQPSGSLSLDDIQITTSRLLSCGGTIDEINTIRKHLDNLKGGGLAKYLFPATVISLLLSDVIGDRLDSIASGPTAADPSTFKDSWDILEKYQIIDQIPQGVLHHLAEGIAGNITETVKPGDPVLERVKCFLIGNNSQSLQGAAQASTALGFTTEILSSALNGEARQVGEMLSLNAISRFSSPNTNRPVCMIAGGETTVTLKGAGQGGRNQELVLGAVENLSHGMQMFLISLATDGGDGPTDVAGAVATDQTYSRGAKLGSYPSEYLDRNDSYHYFEPLADLIKTGPTLTNVNDVVFIFQL